MKEKNKVPDECFELFDPPGDHYSSGGKLGRALSGMRTGEPQNEWLRTEPEKYRLFDGSEAERDELSGWRCSHCSDYHELDRQTKYLLICPNLSRSAGVLRAKGTVERWLAQATGQPSTVAAEMLGNAAAHIVQWHEHHPRWGRAVLEHYWQNDDLYPFLQEYFIEEDDSVDSDEANIEIKRLIAANLEKSDAIARKMAGRNPKKLVEFEIVGEKALEEAARAYDPKRGVSFWYFAKRRITGAINDAGLATDAAVARTRLFTGNKGTAGMAEPVARTSDRPKRLRSSSGAFKNRPRSYIENPSSGGSRLIQQKHHVIDLKAALKKLNHRQRVVYEMRVLADPPVPRDEVARKLGISQSNHVPRIQHQAERKVARILSGPRKSGTP